MNNIKFSILLITYNQEKYIKETIQSILNQTYQNFEIILSDDCSTDNTIKFVQEINDDRIKIVKTPFNKGINANLNNAFLNSTGSYVIFLGGDDNLRSNYLETLNNLIQTNNNLKVFYSNSTLIDSKSEYIEGKNAKTCNYFNNYTREKILYDMFMKSNKLPSPGMVIQRETLLKLYPLKNSLTIYQDFVLNIELLCNLNNDFMLLDDIFVEYRRFNDARNISNNRNGITTTRSMLETDWLMDAFLKIGDIEFLKTVFKKEINETNIEPYIDTIPFFLGQMALKSPDKNRQVWGYKTIGNFISDDKGYNLAFEKYNFTFKDYLACSSLINGNDKSDFYSKYQKYKKSLNLTIIISSVVVLILLSIIAFLIFFK